VAKFFAVSGKSSWRAGLLEFHRNPFHFYRNLAHQPDRGANGPLENQTPVLPNSLVPAEEEGAAEGRKGGQEPANRLCFCSFDRARAQAPLQYSRSHLFSGQRL